MRRWLPGLLLLPVTAGVVAVASCSPTSAALDADRQAAALARGDVDTLAGLLADYLQSAARQGRTPTQALPGARVAGGSGVRDVVLLAAVADGSDIRLDVAVARSASTGGGTSSGDATVRVCARLTAPVRTESATVVSDLSCPAGLSPTSGGSAVSATASYHP